MHRILVVDDEEKIRELIKKYAEFEGYSVCEAGNGIEAIEILGRESIDLIVLDVMMPELDGFSTCKEIRKTSDVPVIMLSARGEEYDRIHGFELGVDDYVVKPFSPKELMMRVGAVIGRGRKSELAREKFECDGLEVDFTARTAKLDGVRIDLSPKEYELLSYMVKNRNIALTREKLITEVWGYDFYGDDRTLDTHIKLLRKRLGDCSKHIVTLRGVGYRFETEGA
ncbi:transcriptional regulatory protein SrrA [Andreesenia angusta]|uniref:Transcriptional regulatory protein SrrA n=1 Tax=Andreesenia angusta TaxID=39480 RepID=A0A1S1V7F7_9FIRM|nr:response regulator transcription factor [Andreesenia angusta]OHW62330.1 transcriptional regulatory protein SrrA [Andreesenia angusta]